MKQKNILLLASYAKSLTHFRGDFIKALVAKGYNVFAAAPDIDSDIKEKLISIKATPIQIPLNRTGLNPFKDLNSFFKIRKVIIKNNIDIVFPYTIKPVIYGSLAARATKATVYSLITGLGYTFAGVSKKARALQKVSQLLYKIALKKNKAIIFQNEDDLKLFQEKKIVTNQPYYIVDGSGVNLTKYKFRRKENSENKVIFVFVARLIKEKGINLFIEAAAILKEKYPTAEFHILGDVPKNSPSAIDKEVLKIAHLNNIIVHHGTQPNIEKFLHKSDVFVLPTFYREGIPRSILEALSVGMPIITTDTPGCRNTVISKKNGILIQPNNLESLVEAMRFFIENPNKIAVMGIESRKLAEKKFDVNIINQNLLDIIEKHET